MIVGPDILFSHPTEVLNREPWKLVLSECGYDRTPSGGRFLGSFIESLEGAQGKLALGVEVDEVMGYEGYDFETRFEDMGMQLKTLLEGPRASQGQKEVADPPVMELEGNRLVQGVLVNHRSMILDMVFGRDRHGRHPPAMSWIKPILSLLQDQYISKNAQKAEDLRVQFFTKNCMKILKR